MESGQGQSADSESKTQRIKHRDRKYPGCWYYETDGNKTFYCAYRKEGKNITAKCGESEKGYTFRQCAFHRADLLRGKASTNAELRRDKESEATRYIDKLYEHYHTEKNGQGQNDSLFLRYVAVFWKDKDISACSNVDAANFRCWLDKCESSRGGLLSKQTVKHAIALFRRIVRYADKTIHDFKLQITDFDIPIVNNETTEDLDHEELERLLQVLKTDKVNRAVCDMMLLMLNTGMRRGEVQKLQWGHINVERGAILLREPKGGKDVTIPMSSGVKAVLLRQKRTSLYVFPGKDGGKRGHFERAARRIRDLAKLGKDFRPCHGLRHYFGTELSDRGVDLVTISELMGHKGVEITKRYVKGREQRKKEAVELIAIGGGK